MKKLSLDLDALSVDSFSASPDRAGAGKTVFGHQHLTDVGGYGCSGNWCQGQTTAPCWAGTYEGHGCDSTQLQILCGCTAGVDGTCDLSCAGTCAGGEFTCDLSCDSPRNCPTAAGYMGC